MPTCKYCERTDYPLSVNRRGLCQDCAKLFGPDIEQKVNEVSAYSAALLTTKDPAIYLGQINILIHLLQSLSNQYHSKGIETTIPDPTRRLLDLVRFNNAKHELEPEMYPFLAIEVPVYKIKSFGNEN